MPTYPPEEIRMLINSNAKEHKFSPLFSYDFGLRHQDHRHHSDGHRNCRRLIVLKSIWQCLSTQPGRPLSQTDDGHVVTMCLATTRRIRQPSVSPLPAFLGARAITWCHEGSFCHQTILEEMKASLNGVLPAILPGD